MESQVNPNNIQARADKLAPEVKPDATPALPPEVKPDVKPESQPESQPETKPDVKPEVKPDGKPADHKPEVKQPNDPAELRKWATKASQENAALRDEIKAVKAAIDKLTKTPVDYKELAKNPDAIKKQIEVERAEAIAEMQTQLEEKTHEARKNETIVERIKRSEDKENYPDWDRVFPLVQTFAANADGRINFNQAPGAVLDDMYALALQMSPAAPPAPAPAAPAAPAANAPVKTVDEIAAEHAAAIAAAEKRGFEKAQEALRLEQNGQGIGSAGKGGRRSSGVSKEALAEMPLDELKKLISKE